MEAKKNQKHFFTSCVPPVGSSLWILLQKPLSRLQLQHVDGWRDHKWGKRDGKVGRRVGRWGVRGGWEGRKVEGNGKEGRKVGR